MTVGIFSQRCLVLETLHHSKLRQCLGQQRMRGVVKILKRFFRGFDKISFKKQKPLEIFFLVRNSFIRKNHFVTSHYIELKYEQVVKKAVGLTVATQYLLPSLALETL